MTSIRSVPPVLLAQFSSDIPVLACESYAFHQENIQYTDVIRPLKKPKLTANQVKDRAKDVGKVDILNFLNRDIQDEDQKEREVPDSIHQILGVSNFNMRRQINRLKGWIIIPYYS